MGRTGKYCHKPTEHWKGLLSSEDPLERRLACYALGECGARDPQVLDGLRRTASDDYESFVRVWAAASLINLAPGDADAYRVIIEACADPADFVRSLAVWMLGRLTPVATEDAVAAVRGLLGDEAASVRAEAGIALERLARSAGR